MRSITLTIIGLGFLVYLIAFASKGGLGGLLFFLPFIMTPLIVNANLAWRWQTKVAQALLQLATLAYAGWAIHIYIDVFYIHPDPQSAVALVFVGIYAAPPLVVVWGLGYLWELRLR